MCKFCDEKLIVNSDSAYLDNLRVNYCPICGKRLIPFIENDISDLSYDDQKSILDEYRRLKYGQKGALYGDLNEGGLIDIDPEIVEIGVHPVLGVLPEWMKDIYSYVGEYCYDESGNDLGILEGCTASFEDYYYKILRNGTYEYESCVGKIRFSRD